MLISKGYANAAYTSVVCNWARKFYVMTDEKMKRLIGSILVSLSFWSCGQFNSISGLTIDPAIKAEADKHFKTESEFEKVNTSGSGFQIFENSLEFDFYENDSLVGSSQGKPKAILFKSFYFWKEDTLIIDGAIGLFGGGGFSIQIANGKATVYHMVSSDNFPTYAYGENTQVIFRLDVSCHHVKAIVSEIPIKGTGKVIYGYVEFESEDYYSAQGTEAAPRKKSRSNMKMYFKSGELKL